MDLKLRTIGGTTTRPAGALQVDFHRLGIVLAHPADPECDRLLRQLQRLGCRVEQRWPPSPTLDGHIDLLLCLADARALELIDRALTRPGTAVIAIVDPRVVGGMRVLDSVIPHAVLVRPIDPGAVLPNLLVARNMARYQQRLLGKVDKLAETLRSYRKVERAKTILMEARWLDEPDAYRYLREQAMRRRVPIGVVAAAIIDANEMLSQAGD
jgi:AmiR/NasT family two-component response regulator